MERMQRKDFQEQQNSFVEKDDKSFCQNESAATQSNTFSTKFLESNLSVSSSSDEEVKLNQFIDD
jgi:hypothetical protein